MVEKVESLEKLGWDFYHCYHEDKILVQKKVHATFSNPKCNRCGKIMTFGRFTSLIENGMLDYKIVKPLFS